MNAAAKNTEIQNPIIGIDLGTTNSLVAWCDAAGPRILTTHDQPPMLPSVVRFDPDTGKPLAIGHDAKRHAVEFPHDTIFSVKRLMGRSLDDVRDDLQYLSYDVVAGEHDTARVQVGEHVISPQQISAMILGELRARAEAALGCEVKKAVVTVPAYFDDAQRQATRDAGRLAGLDVLRIVNEPTAAALAYNLDQPHADTTVAIFDLGGGTFDISILRLQHSDQGVVDQVLATAGDTHLGGDDVDHLIVEFFQQQIRKQFGSDINFPVATRQAFRNLAEATKIRLSSEQTAAVEIDLGDGRTLSTTLTRDQLQTMITPWIDKALNACRTALQAAKLTPEDIERVIMVGGSTRIPLVRQRVAEFFQSDPYVALDPDQVVALGAAVQASILAGINRDMLLLDVVPLSLGIETLGGAVAKLIMANTTIPARATEKFSTYVDGQTNVKIHVLQGERELVEDCRSLGQFDLRGIPPMPAGLPKLEVTFLVDANGILNVSAIEKRSEVTAKIQIVPNHGLSREEVDRIERESIDHARDDMTAHRLIDLRNQARLDLRQIDRQLAKVGDQLDTDYKTSLEAKADALRKLVDDPAAEADTLAAALKDVDHHSVRLAELAVKHALTEKDE